jgi:hypothetical protein
MSEYIIRVNEEHLGTTKEQVERFVYLMQQKGWSISYGTDNGPHDDIDMGKFDADSDQVLDWIATDATDEDIDQLNNVMTVEEIAAEYDRDAGHIRGMITSGVLTARKSGNTYLVLRRLIEARWGRVVISHGETINFDAAAVLMDEDIADELDRLDLPSNQHFFDTYAAKHFEKFGEEWEPAKVNPVW